MKLVIEIDSYVLEHCKRHVREHYANNLEEAIANGTPLPKGHGRLIDADILWDLYHGNDYDFYEALDDVQTIVEAESEE